MGTVNKTGAEKKGRAARHAGTGSKGPGTVALVLAGYNKLNFKLANKIRKEIVESYDGLEIYIGNNKFLYDLAGKPVIQYVIDAIYNARKNGKRLYDKIYVYNDVASFNRVINVKKYHNLFIHQMKSSIGSHLMDFYFNYMEYGQRVDVFFGDTPRVQSDDIEWIHDRYSEIVGKQIDHRGVLIRGFYTLARFQDMTDNWLPSRIKVVKRGFYKGKLKRFFNIDGVDARIGNSASFLRHECYDDLIRNRMIDVAYNLRMALAPSNFFRVLRNSIKSGHFDLVWQILKNKIQSKTALDTIYDFSSFMFKIDLSKTAAGFFYAERNASRWENDIDGPKDLEDMRRRFEELKGG